MPITKCRHDFYSWLNTSMHIITHNRKRCHMLITAPGYESAPIAMPSIAVGTHHLTPPWQSSPRIHHVVHKLLEMMRKAAFRCTSGWYDMHSCRSIRWRITLCTAISELLDSSHGWIGCSNGYLFTNNGCFFVSLWLSIESLQEGRPDTVQKLAVHCRGSSTAGSNVSDMQCGRSIRSPEELIDAPLTIVASWYYVMKLL